MSPWSIVVSSSKQARLVITEVVLEAGYGCVAFLLTPFFFYSRLFLGCYLGTLGHGLRLPKASESIAKNLELSNLLV